VRRPPTTLVSVAAMRMVTYNHAIATLYTADVPIGPTQGF
jgi:hypothetical protein